MKRFLAVVIIPQRTSEVRKFKVSVAMFALAFLLIASALSFSGWLYFQFFNLKDRLFDLDTLRSSVDLQEKDLEFFRNELTELKLEYDQIDREASKLKRLTSVEAEQSPTENQDRQFLQRLDKDSSVLILDLIRSKDQSAALGETADKLKTRHLLDYVSEIRNPVSGIPASWPVRGYLISGFGFETEPFADKTNLNGIVVGTDPNTSVKATADGVVVFAGTDEKFGKTLRIYHTDMILTTFGYLSEIKFALGDRVNKGDVVGVVGLSKNLNVPQLYYEISVNGIPQNPIQYIRSE